MDDNHHMFKIKKKINTSGINMDFPKCHSAALLQCYKT